MSGKISHILFFGAALIAPFKGIAQNYVGYSKQHILEAIKAERHDLRGPAIVKSGDDNYVIYSTRNAQRAIVYFFEPMVVTLDDGRQMKGEICVKYYSKNKCINTALCPQMDDVVRSLDSHFEKGDTHLQWIDYSKRSPQEWMLVRDNDYFEVHVMELEK